MPAENPADKPAEKAAPNPGRPQSPAGARSLLVLLPLVLVASVLTLLTAAHPAQPRTDAAATAAATTSGDAYRDARQDGRPAEQPIRRPNVVLVMADDMRVDDLRYAPTVRKVLGENGVTFDNAFSPFPLCCPARASFLTGRYAHNHHVYWHERPYGFGAFDDSHTIAGSLRAAGYRTGFVGKYLNGYGVMRAKVTGRASLRYAPAGWSDWYGALENPGDAGIHGSTYNYFDTPYNINGKIKNSYRGQYQTDVVGRFGRQLVRRYHRSTNPFFLYLSFVAPHHGGPREGDDPGSVRRNDGKLVKFQTPARPSWVKGRFDRAIKRGAGMPKDGGPAEASVSDKPGRFKRPDLNAAERRALREVTRQRAEAVFVLDRQVKKLVATLKKSGEWNNTVLMFTSDNGYYLGEHRIRTGKVMAHEPSLRVPFLATGPGMRDGSHRSDPMSTVDLTATILDAAGARPPQTPDGISRWRTMRYGDAGWDVPVVTEAIHSGPRKRRGSAFAASDARTTIGLRTAQYSYTRYRSRAGELYDLARDPNQLTNRYRDPAYRKVRRDLDRIWRRYKDCRGAACRVPMPAPYAVTPTRAASLTATYWRGVRKEYGGGW
ncbi:sulfatase [Nocardioides sp. zg-536]|uniref:Sulfatase n=1 Tax=Nocardioides faecalis TaxID=2803858 RepID=A0A939BWK2_9ACTN|nr:sulfatase [Nocardioides faecalis]MBM9461126.1 sulfatase [Nocardioides faecalis]QVI58982.1 sulfatase [Nocardioides faecalis]